MTLTGGKYAHSSEREDDTDDDSNDEYKDDNCNNGSNTDDNDDDDDDTVINNNNNNTELSDNDSEVQKLKFGNTDKHSPKLLFPKVDCNIGSKQNTVTPSTTESNKRNKTLIKFKETAAGVKKRMKTLHHQMSNKKGPTLNIGQGSAVLTMANILVTENECLKEKEKRDNDLHQMDLKSKHMKHNAEAMGYCNAEKKSNPNFTVDELDKLFLLVTYKSIYKSEMYGYFPNLYYVI